MHYITKSLFDFTDKLCYDTIPLEERHNLIEQFNTAVKSKFEDNVLRESSDGYRLRMSSIGKPIRQSLLEQKYGRKPMTRDMYFKMLFGHLAEAALVAHMKAAGINIQEENKKVSLQVTDEIAIDGEYDLKIDGLIWDVKTASDRSYNQKFKDWESVVKTDDFGYMAQLFGYAEADNSPAGGWIVLNKNNSEIKVVPIPKKEHAYLRKSYLAEIKDKAEHLVYRPDDIPPCDGVVDEWFNRKTTGNKIIGMKCRWCPFKTEVCHKGNISKVECVNSKAKEKTIKEYVGHYE
jgi:hypothetical protein